MENTIDSTSASVEVQNESITVISEIGNEVEEVSTEVNSILNQNAENIEGVPICGDLLKKYAQTPQVNSNERKLYEMTKEILSVKRTYGENNFQVLLLETALKTFMETKKIDSMKHCEGPTVLDHIKEGMEIIRARNDIPDDKKKFLETVFFFHDIGKTDPQIQKANKEKNKNPNNKGMYNVSYIGHADFDKMTPGTEETLSGYLEQNGLNEKECEDALWIIKNHMNAGLIEPDSKLANSVKVYNENPEAFQMLMEIIAIDGQATVSYSVEEGFADNSKKSSIDYPKIIENIQTYNEVHNSLSTDPKIRQKQEQKMNEYFNQVKNFDDIQKNSIDELKVTLEELAKIDKNILDIPTELKRELGKILKGDLKKLEPVYWDVVGKIDNKDEVDKILIGILGFTKEIAHQTYEITKAFLKNNF